MNSESTSGIRIVGIKQGDELMVDLTFYPINGEPRGFLLSGDFAAQIAYGIVSEIERVRGGSTGLEQR